MTKSRRGGTDRSHERGLTEATAAIWRPDPVSVQHPAKLVPRYLGPPPA